MDISIDDVSWYTLSELFGNVLTAKQKHLGISTNAKFLNQNDGSGWGQKVCLTLTLLKKNISDPFQNDEKKKKHQPWDSHKSNMGVLHNFQLLGYCSTIVFRQTVRAIDCKHTTVLSHTVICINIAF